MPLLLSRADTRGVPCADAWTVPGGHTFSVVIKGNTVLGCSLGDTGSPQNWNL